MSPVTSIAASLPAWVYAVPVVCLAVYVAFIARPFVPAKASKQAPSPKGVPVLGNVLDVLREQPWIRFAQLADELGPIFRFNILDQMHVVLSDEKIAYELLEERGLQYSNRPWFNFTCGLLTGDLHLLLMSNNDRFRRYQTFLHTVMANTAAGTYDSMQIIEAKRMLDSLISAPSQYDRWLDGFSASVTARLTWGKHVETGGEEFFRTLHDISQTFEQVGDRGSKIYSRFPSLLLLPDWIAPLKRTARSLHMWETNFFKRLINETRLDMAAGATQPSFAWHFIQNKSSGLSETEGAHALGGVFEVASRMIAAQMKSFCLALCLYPEWQDKLQTEIDAICGDRVPEFADMQSLPVTRAILVEVTRWRPACPVGLPHVLSQDDTYDGYHFKKGTIFHPNIWAMTHNPSLYPSPNTFNPARWLTPSYPTFRSPLSRYPSLSLMPMPLFGYGPRRCPGMHIAERSLFIQAAYIGWACTLVSKPDAGITADDFTTAQMGMTGLVSAPKRWAFDVVPRKGREVVVRREALLAADKDPLKTGAGVMRRVERIAFKREGTFNPSY